MSCELVVVDCFGREVVLEHSNWVGHIEENRHPEVVEYHDRFALVLQNPDFVVEADRDGQQHFYRLGIGGGRYRNLYLQLIVVEFAGVYKVTTWRFSGRIVKGKIVYGSR